MLNALDTVRVVNFVKPFRSGANEPWLAICINSSGQRDEYVVKFHGVLQRNIIKEYAAAYLAACLKVQMPPAAFVEVPDALGINHPNPMLRQKFGAKSNPHWGTKYLTGYAELTIDTIISDSMISDKIRLFAFDMLIQNFDRTTNGIGKPNLLVCGDDFVAIDHDKTFFCTDRLARIDPREPWELRGTNEELSHVFKPDIYRYAKKYDVSFKAFLEELEGLPDNTISTMFNRMPFKWRDNTYERYILEHVAKIRANLSKFSHGLLEVFA